MSGLFAGVPKAASKDGIPIGRCALLPTVSCRPRKQHPRERRSNQAGEVHASQHSARALGKTTASQADFQRRSALPTRRRAGGKTRPRRSSGCRPGFPTRRRAWENTADTRQQASYHSQSAGARVGKRQGKGWCRSKTTPNTSARMRANRTPPRGQNSSGLPTLSARICKPRSGRMYNRVDALMDIW